MLASKAGWATTDVQEVGSQPDFRVTFARMTTRLLREMSRQHRVAGRVELALGVVKAFSLAVPSGIQLRIEVDAASGIADSGDPEQDLTDLVREIGEVALAAGTGALFLVDEMHHLDESSLAAICIAFQAISRNSLPIAMVGAGLPDLQVRLMSAKPYADRLFEYRVLGRLRDAAARTALVAPAATRGVAFQEGAPVTSSRNPRGIRTSSRSSASSSGTKPRRLRSPTRTSQRCAKSSLIHWRGTSSAPAFSSPPTPARPAGLHRAAVRRVSAREPSAGNL